MSFHLFFVFVSVCIKEPISVLKSLLQDTLKNHRNKERPPWARLLQLHHWSFFLSILEEHRMCTARSHLHNSEGKHFLFMLVSQHNMVARRTDLMLFSLKKNLCFFYFFFFCLFYFTVGREHLLSWGNSEDARLVSDGHTSKRPCCAINRGKSWKTGCQKPSRGKDNGQSLHDSVIISLNAMIAHFECEPQSD